jgi:hypothetical protein
VWSPWRKDWIFAFCFCRLFLFTGFTFLVGCFNCRLFCYINSEHQYTIVCDAVSKLRCSIFSVLYILGTWGMKECNRDTKSKIHTYIVLIVNNNISDYRLFSFDTKQTKDYKPN